MRSRTFFGSRPNPNITYFRSHGHHFQDISHAVLLEDHNVSVSENGSVSGEIAFRRVSRLVVQYGTEPQHHF